MRYLMAALAIATCPCHLPVLLVVLGGTALGAALSEYAAVVMLAPSVLFALSAWAAFRMFSQPGPAEGESRAAGMEKVGGAPREPGGIAR